MRKSSLARLGAVVVLLAAASSHAAPPAPPSQGPSTTPRPTAATQVRVVTDANSLAVIRAKVAAAGPKLDAPRRAALDRHAQAAKAWSARLEKPLLAAASKTGFDSKGFLADVQALSNEKDPKQRAALEAKLSAWTPKLAAVASASSIDFASERRTVLSAMKMPEAAAKGTPGSALSFDHVSIDYGGVPLDAAIMPPAPAPPAATGQRTMITQPFALLEHHGSATVDSSGAMSVGDGALVPFTHYAAHASAGGAVRVDAGLRHVVATADFKDHYHVLTAAFGAYATGAAGATLRVVDGAGTALCETHITLRHNECAGLCYLNTDTRETRSLKCIFDRADASIASDYAAVLLLYTSVEIDGSGNSQSYQTATLESIDVAASP